MYRIRSHSVYPRYSCGSPASVDEPTARIVLEDERHGYHAALSGIYGADQRQRAERLGLSGIVERHQVRAHHIDFVDELTGERGVRKQGRRTVTQRLEGGLLVSVDPSRPESSANRPVSRS